MCVCVCVCVCVSSLHFAEDLDSNPSHQTPWVRQRITLEREREHDRNVVLGLTGLLMKEII